MGWVPLTLPCHGKLGQLCSIPFPTMILFCSKACGSWLVEFNVMLLWFYLCAIFSQRRLVGGGQSSPWGKVWWSRKGPGERRAPFSPKSSNPWLNRELFPKPHGNRAVLQIWLEMFTPRAGKCWRRNPYPRKGRTAFSVQSLFSRAVCKMQLLIPHNRKCSLKEHIVFISTY